MASASSNTDLNSISSPTTVTTTSIANANTDLNSITSSPATLDPTQANVQTSSAGPSSSDITIYASPPTVDSVSNAVDNGTADLNVIATAPVPTVDSVSNAIVNGTADLNVIATASSGAQGLTGQVAAAQSSATAQDQANATASNSDWRVRLSLAPGAKYFYNIATSTDIMYPLLNTNGVIFPYTPQIVVNYAANYEQAALTYTNYKVFQYTASSIDTVQLTCEFTCQDVAESRYLLATIHFFRTMTKMFYGQDSNPKNGTPPPLCYIHGMGGYQFDNLPLAISGFNYSLPNDVDYIKTSSPSPAGTLQAPASVPISSSVLARTGGQLDSGGTQPGPWFPATPQSASETTTWVPTKIQLSITCVPMISRNKISNHFSLKDYASGNLLQGTKENGGFW